MNLPEGPRYDVAISLLASDERLGQELHDALRPRVGEIFFYPESQRDLVGEDGIERFRRAFLSESRVVVVLYRGEWGRTPWTGIEETAIKERGLVNNWENLVVVPLDDPPAPPPWLPTFRLWTGWQQYGVGEVAAGIARKVQEAGGRPFAETPMEHLERVLRKVAVRRERDETRRSGTGVQGANEALRELWRELENETVELSNTGQTFTYEQQGEGRALVHGFQTSARLTWKPVASNSVAGARLEVLVTRHHWVGQGKPGLRVDADLKADLAQDGRWGWRLLSRSQRWFSSAELADWTLHELIEQAGLNLLSSP